MARRGGNGKQQLIGPELSLVDLLMDYIHGDIGEWTRGAFLAILHVFLVIFCVCSLPAGTGVEEYLEESVFGQVRYVCAFMHVLYVCM